MNYLMLIVIAYLLGSIPFGLILARLAGKGDIRKVGSGNIGATNVARVAGLGGFLSTVILDFGKSIAAVLLGTYYISPAFGALCGFFAVVGHCFPIWLKFKGGKGNAPMFGVLLATNPLIFIIVGIEWLIVAVSSGYSSLGAVVAFFIMPLIGFAMDWKIGMVFVAISVLCLFQHRSNIKRLMDGTESKIQMNKGKMAIGLVLIGLVLSAIFAAAMFA